MQSIKGCIPGQDPRRDHVIVSSLRCQMAAPRRAAMAAVAIVSVLYTGSTSGGQQQGIVGKLNERETQTHKNK